MSVSDFSDDTFERATMTIERNPPHFFRKACNRLLKIIIRMHGKTLPSSNSRQKQYKASINNNLVLPLLKDTRFSKWIGLRPSVPPVDTFVKEWIALRTNS
ncbi:hypothetical protein GJ496_002612 [Pomphorhynchus laevis]|nr:hypothetical protein GJ496_002612 [Pomphorhynchus laevis]